MSEPHILYFRGRRVLITGGFGFIGSNLCARLLDLGSEVTLIDRSAPEDRLYQSMHPCLRVIRADIRDERVIKNAVLGRDVVFDLAGSSGAADSNKAPLNDLDVNCRGHLTVLEACRLVNPSAAIVFPSSRLVYGKPLYLPVDEQHPLSPESIYAAHKLTVENYFLIFARLYGLKATVLRISNPYGPMQSGKIRNYGIANRFIHAAVNGERIILFGAGQQCRDYLYIDDLIDVLLRSAWSEASRSKIYNIGSGQGTSLFEMAEMATAAARAGEIGCVPWPEDYQAIETGDYVSDIALVEQELGWRPTTAIGDGVSQTVKFYQRRAARTADMESHRGRSATAVPGAEVC